MPTNPLLTPLTTGAIHAANRVWMAPLTRSRATMPGNIPNALMADYYAQRADPTTGAGVIIAEATPVSPTAYGYYATPGVHTDAQEAGWRLVTDAVHARGGRIVLQLWHVGRVSHHALQPGNQPPVSSTTEPSRSKTYIDATFERHINTPPRLLRPDELPAIAADFANAARRAIRAGFDGVEIHGANTYLLDQFTRDGMNRMPEPWGGSLENRLRFPLLVAQSVVDAVGAGRVGYRISPLSDHHDAVDSDPATTFSALATSLGAMGLAYLHAVETWDRAKIDPRVATVIPRIASAFKTSGGGAYIANGDYTPQQAAEAIRTNWSDAVAFGKRWISNPDLTERIRRGGPYNAWNTETFYGGAAEGYTDYDPLDAPARIHG
jgi:N-ethylmaleimide reductase